VPPIFCQLTRNANALAMALATSSPTRRRHLARRARRWLIVNERLLDRNIRRLTPEHARDARVSAAMRSILRLRALVDAAPTGADGEAEALDPDVAHLLDLTRRYIANQNVPMHALARDVRSIRGRAGTLSVRDLDLAVGAVTNIDSHRRRAGIGPASFGPPLRAAARAADPPLITRRLAVAGMTSAH
jgi:hypothetical protein